MESIAQQIYDTLPSGDMEVCRYLSHMMVEESVPTSRSFPWECMVSVVNVGLVVPHRISIDVQAHPQMDHHRDKPHRISICAIKRVDTPLGYREAYMMKCLMSVEEVIGFRGCCSLEDGCLIMMEVGGMDLIEAIRCGTQVTPTWILDIVRGVRGMHRLDIVHGDIKPENLLLMTDGHVKICDLGSCFIPGMRSRDVVGTLPYMAPEMRESLLDRISVSHPDKSGERSVMRESCVSHPDLSGERSVMYGKEIDVWSVSCVILGLKTRHLPPFRDREDMMRVAGLISGEGKGMYPGLMMDPEIRPGIEVVTEFYERYIG